MIECKWEAWVVMVNPLSCALFPQPQMVTSSEKAIIDKVIDDGPQIAGTLKADDVRSMLDRTLVSKHLSQMHTLGAKSAYESHFQP